MKTKIKMHKNIDETSEILIDIAKETSKHAISEAKRLGLPIVYIEDGFLIREDASGEKVVLKKIEKKIFSNKIKLSKGIVLHARD